ncbi:MAG: hypothetical protein ACFE9R_06660 [Candidatus Hermodarchaeota archaeon]
MDSDELFQKLKNYFLNKLDLMRHLKKDACWEYKINEKSTLDEIPKLHYYLYKGDNERLKIDRQDPGIKPDLILFFTEESILMLIKDNPNADEYFERYRNLMSDSSNLLVDSKINKSRFNLLRLGYQKWQNDFKF